MCNGSPQSLFYKHKLKCPIEELELASRQVGRNNLDFHITYENEDEMGGLCKEFERMRGQLAENNQQLWKIRFSDASTASLPT